MIQAGNSARFLGDAAGAAGYYARAAAMRPDAYIPPYATACLQAVNGELEPALASLGRAVDLGFAAPALLEGNEDFDGLRPLAGWSALLVRVQEAASRAGQGGVRAG